MVLRLKVSVLGDKHARLLDSGTRDISHPRPGVAFEFQPVSRVCSKLTRSSDSRDNTPQLIVLD